MSQSYVDFGKAVSTFRSLSPESLNSIARGRIWSGKQGKANGLVDDLGGLLKAIQIAQNLSIGPDKQGSKRIHWTLYPPTATFWQKIQRFFSVSLPDLIVIL